jgi:hypothetical protein
VGVNLNKCLAGGKTDHVYVIVLSASFAASLVSGVVVLGAATCGGKTSGSWLRAAAYPISFLVCQVVNVCMALNWTRLSPEWMVTVGVTLQNLTGFVNTLIYFLQSFLILRLLRKRLERAELTSEAEQAEERVVRIAGGVQELDFAPYAEPPLRLLGSASSVTPNPSTPSQTQLVSSLYSQRCSTE